MRITRSFERSEFDCHDGTAFPVDLLPNLERLCGDVLQPIRDEWGQPIIVVSGWRTHAWNQRIGGAEHSMHLTGEAADIRPLSPRDVPELLELVESMRNRGHLDRLTGLGSYPRWVHVDVGRTTPTGRLRRWLGTGMASEPNT